jgi:acyl dehydratase
MGGKAGATAPAQVGAFHFGEHGLGTARERRAQRLAGRPSRRQQGIAPPDMVLDQKILARPVVERHLRPNEFAEAIDTLGRQAGDRPAIDQQRRPLITQAGAGRRIDAEQPILGNLAPFDPQLVAQAVEQFDAAQHTVGDVVREQHAITADGRQMQKRIEAGNAFDARSRQVDRARNRGQRRRRQVAQKLLRRPQNLYELQRIMLVGVEQRLQPLFQPFPSKALFGHPRLPQPEQLPARWPSLPRPGQPVLIHVNNPARRSAYPFVLRCSIMAVVCGLSLKPGSDPHFARHSEGPRMHFETPLEYLESRTYEEINLGDSSSLVRTLCPEDVRLFALMSGDMNPALANAEFRHSGLFQDFIAHGMWTASLLSTTLGTQFPGPGTVLIESTLHFTRPVTIGDTVTVTVTVRQKFDHNHHIILDCCCHNQDELLVVSGSAEVLAPAEKIRTKRTAMPEITISDKYARLQVLVSTCLGSGADRHGGGSPLRPRGRSRARCWPPKPSSSSPILIGPEQRIRAVAEENGLDLKDYRIVNCKHSHESAAMAVTLIRSGDAEALMKGSLHTDELMAAVVSSEFDGLRTGRRISHVFLIDVPSYPRNRCMISDGRHQRRARRSTEKRRYRAAMPSISRTPWASPEPKVAILWRRWKRSTPSMQLDARCRRTVQDGRPRADQGRPHRRTARFRQRDVCQSPPKTKGIESRRWRGSADILIVARPRSRQHDRQAARIPGGRTESPVW